MNILYHFELCPFSRKVRVYLYEKNFDIKLSGKKYWDRPDELMYMHPACEVPIIAFSDQNVIWGSYPIIEYFEESLSDNSLLGNSPEDRAKTREIMSWFDNKFYNEVLKYLINEKVIKYYTQSDHPNSQAIRAAKTNFDYHMKYIEFLLKRSKWLSGNIFNLSDITAASHISIVDYLGDVNWANYPAAKEWYALVKSRPSFRNILKDRVPVFSPPKYYDNPDF